MKRTDILLLQYAVACTNPEGIGFARTHKPAVLKLFLGSLMLSAVGEIFPNGPLFKHAGAFADDLRDLSPFRIL